MSRTAAVDVPLLLTAASLPGEPVVTVPTTTVAAKPCGPVGPVITVTTLVFGSLTTAVVMLCTLAHGDHTLKIVLTQARRILNHDVVVENVRELSSLRIG